MFVGIESFSKLGDSIYFEEKGERPALYIIQFIPNKFNWRTAGLAVTLKLEPLSSSDQNLQVSLSVSAKVNIQEIVKCTERKDSLYHSNLALRQFDFCNADSQSVCDIERKNTNMDIFQWCKGNFE